MKKIALASDHGGVKLKNQMIEYLKTKGYQVVDLGPSDDSKSISYAEQGHKLANYIIDNNIETSLAFCGTGLGISYALNRHKKIRAARVVTVEDAHLAKQHNNANVLVMGGRYVPYEDAVKMFDEFEKTEYEGGRHQARIEQLDNF
ncbi:RpiB/LacA/LacB family sugar-phosphate isomerase [Mycoplasma sp. Mirounga ES2805-ORL]|uniref:RpiB/LacA/LacB family sugar-phosphate isomerase n=1 Tax=Mycoplasma sp. Mirounga ES2805-ORL TaxID=754514 RepID=UPI00197C0692|nr:RpiB/LacA/LacB family sugar-phosphate isomerase [Mycoplasma sp. Mirounga ES2805-ORL]QSF13477.1 RpiB/LacA/LacB family sugar-phosphate isomerase [Mycoplasma sp. Mirounga ES2805-ORL]